MHLEHLRLLFKHLRPHRIFTAIPVEAFFFQPSSWPSLHGCVAVLSIRTLRLTRRSIAHRSLRMADGAYSFDSEADLWPWRFDLAVESLPTHRMRTSASSTSTVLADAWSGAFENRCPTSRSRLGLDIAGTRWKCRVYVCNQTIQPRRAARQGSWSFSLGPHIHPSLSLSLCLTVMVQ